ncbi:threonine synthase [Neisseria elongata subsp. glycolytica ATCC 29315]|uniref:Threonine synthase n=1 Tax=Neisseria elongata subsp. glycolytica ATCC 29315 TaxID=546263 RepID=D4DUT8_NEIEG|nr:threonine synthase [Neisseria elongata]AJE18871.1 threonine synthase [Neisseria elongata subsp. glycolytica ATCC 29315]EFE48414.1 threonine synthase [Neisseria elongata subsp. glycolytica ATCC 29315]SQH50766.1 threonine synthase [Neisseria elongata subsp. glycolytica]
MKYISTRGATDRKTFGEVLLMGLAPDGGLMLPEHYPQIDRATLDKWRGLAYADLAFEIMRLFATDIPEGNLRAIINRTYTAEAFGNAEITPVRTLSDGLKIQALSNGPTLAFKDMAMQFLGNAFEYVLKREGQTLNIVGATSGDTGSAAEYALRGKEGIHVFMMSPEGKMSAFQRAQMYSLQDENIHNIAVDGMFDDCQDIVKAIQNDAAFKEKYRIGTVNSINWGRVMAQVVYYFAGYFKATKSNDETVSFCVPSGNFGNVCAGHIAKQMGLPIRRLMVATNENDVLDEFFKTGSYRPRTAAHTHVTSSPSMDISKASNFERFIFDLTGRDAAEIETLWAEVGTGKGFNLAFALDKIRNEYGFVSGKSLHRDRLAVIKQVYEQDGELIDPHTADGVKVARELREAGETVVCLETALAAKFADTIREAVGDVEIPRPAKLQGLEDLPQKVQNVPNQAEAVKEIIRNVLN